jgi:hypothetical protein
MLDRPSIVILGVFLTLMLAGLSFIAHQTVQVVRLQRDITASHERMTRQHETFMANHATMLRDHEQSMQRHDAFIQQHERLMRDHEAAAVDHRALLQRLAR